MQTGNLTEIWSNHLFPSMGPNEGSVQLWTPNPNIESLSLGAEKPTFRPAKAAFEPEKAAFEPEKSAS
jgi:hypothetical protein